MKKQKNQFITVLCKDFEYGLKIQNVDGGKTHTLVDYNLMLTLDELLETYKTIAENSEHSIFHGKIRLVIDVSSV